MSVRDGNTKRKKTKKKRMIVDDFFLLRLGRRHGYIDRHINKYLSIEEKINDRTISLCRIKAKYENVLGNESDDE